MGPACARPAFAASAVLRTTSLVPARPAPSSVARRRAAPPRTARRAPPACLLRGSSPGRSDDGSRGSSPGRSDDGSRDSEFDLGDAPAARDGADNNELYEFIKTVPPPEMVARFADAAPPVVQTAIRQTIVAMLGSLPSTAFMPRVTTVSANLVQLFHSSLISGYMMRNASYRLELTRTLGGVASGRPALAGAEATPEIVGGEAVFKSDGGVEVRIPVGEYVSELRGQVSELRNELARERKGGNELLSYISTLEQDSLEALTNNAGAEVVDAMKRVVAEVTKAQDIPTRPDAVVDAASSELSQVLLYLMCCGFTLRETEVRVELQRSLEGKSSPGTNLLEGGLSGGPGEDTGSE
jgi:hypothetical protein